MLKSAVLLGAVLATAAWGATSTYHQRPGAAREIGNGAADIGMGTARGTGILAKDTAYGVGHLVTLHPVKATQSVGRGVGLGVKDVSVGAVKGTGKMGQGIGRGFKHIFWG